VHAPVQMHSLNPKGDAGHVHAPVQMHSLNPKGDAGHVYTLLQGHIPPLRDLFSLDAEPFLDARPNITAKEMLRSIRSSNKTWILGEGRIRPVLSNLRKRRSKEERGGASTDATTGAPHRSGGRFVAGTGSDPRQWVQGSFGRPLAQVLGPGKKVPWPIQTKISHIISAHPSCNNPI
jgi:hypothetical protein